MHSGVQRLTGIDLGGEKQRKVLVTRQTTLEDQGLSRVHALRLATLDRHRSGRGKAEKSEHLYVCLHQLGAGQLFGLKRAVHLADCGLYNRKLWCPVLAQTERLGD